MFHALIAAPLSLNTNGLVSYLQGLFALFREKNIRPDDIEAIEVHIPKRGVHRVPCHDGPRDAHGMFVPGDSVWTRRRIPTPPGFCTASCSCGTGMPGAMAAARSSLRCPWTTWRAARR